ncbi:MAG: FtsW/RodA/SpoVE family cell cycle protein [Fimbriimonadaceae bacterium]
MKQRFAVHDQLTLLCAGILTAVGLFFAFDAGFVRSLQHGQGAVPREFVSQLEFLPLALIAGLACSRLRPEFYRRWAVFIWVGCLALLVMALFAPFRHTMNGADRWVKIAGPVQFQPAEFAKLGAILYLAAVFAKRTAWPRKIRRSRTFALWLDTVAIAKLKRWIPAVVVIAGITLIEKEPDMGTGLVIAAAGVAIATTGGATRKSLVFGVLAAVILCAFMLVAQPYRMARIVNHFQRWEQRNIDDSGYQTVQSEIAMAGGGLKGVGSGSGHAKHLMPATTTDFVMATVAEEFGFLGTMFVLGLLAVIVVRLLYRAAATQDRFGKLTLTGVAVWLGFQGCVNLLQANGTLPPIGIPFPFVSSGGSSLLALWAAIGVSEAIAVRRPIASHAVVEEASNAVDSDRRRDGRTRLSRA